MSGETVDRHERLLRSLEQSGIFLVDEMTGRLERYACSRGLDEATTEEVVQEAFTAVFQRRASVTQPEAWLVRVVDRRCCDWHRRRSAAARALAALAERARGADFGPSHEALDLAKALARLPEKLRQVVRLRYVEGLGTTEAASRLGYSPETYRSTLHRTLKSLREILGLERDEASLPVSGS
ncbi:MAG TPA: RNA polymerase sigma factor [Thermoanaerobaculia bacterium]|jgi:RNA polymerase sigma-70 factor (ECF subfamily)